MRFTDMSPARNNWFFHTQSVHETLILDAMYPPACLYFCAEHMARQTCFVLQHIVKNLKTSIDVIQLCRVGLKRDRLPHRLRIIVGL